MNIAINTRLLLKNKLEGIGWFIHEHFSRIVKEHQEHTFFFIFDRSFHKDFIFERNVRPIVAGIPTRHPFLWHLWFQHTLPKVLKKIKADIFISPDGYIPLDLNIPVLNVIHDLNFHHYPENIPFLTRKYLNHYFPKFAKDSKRIVTVSKFSKNDISKTYGIHPYSIDVIYNGINDIYQEKHLGGKKIGHKLSGNKPYFLFVGALNPRKNIARLLKAFDTFKQTDNTECKLLIVGEKMFKTGEISQAFKQMKFADKVTFTGRLEPKDLKSVYSSALALVFVPYFEGFGIPIIEAMSCGIPVICSNVTSLPEVAGNAAILADPFSLKEITKAMIRISKDKEFREDFIKKGLIRKENFSWDKGAKLLWRSIIKCLEQ